MRVGVPRECKVMEFRVGLVPAGARQLVRAGHDVSVERGAGEGSGFGDSDYEAAGATVCSPDEVWVADLVVKV